jgi:hypothetical protein
MRERGSSNKETQKYLPKSSYPQYRAQAHRETVTAEPIAALVEQCTANGRENP